MSCCAFLRLSSRPTLISSRHYGITSTPGVTYSLDETDIDNAHTMTVMLGSFLSSNHLDPTRMLVIRCIAEPWLCEDLTIQAAALRPSGLLLRSSSPHVTQSKTLRPQSSLIITCTLTLAKRVSGGLVTLGRVQWLFKCMSSVSFIRSF